MKVGFYLEVRFFKTEAGTETTIEWLRSLPKWDKKLIGEDIKTVQYGWPIGMPVVKKLCKGIWEIRTNLEDRISRVLFTLLGDKIILLHGFIKKTGKTPEDVLDLAIKRMRQLKKG